MPVPTCRSNRPAPGPQPGRRLCPANRKEAPCPRSLSARKQHRRRDLLRGPRSRHHLLPFSGVAHVGYLPGERIVGLSKLARLVEHFAARPQVQERLTKQVADALASCMMLRGVRAHGAKTVTSALLGCR